MQAGAKTPEAGRKLDDPRRRSDTSRVQFRVEVADARIGFCRIPSCKGKETPVRPLTHTIEFVPNRDEVRTVDLSCESVGTASKFSQASDLIFEEKTADPSSLCGDSAVRP